MKIVKENTGDLTAVLNVTIEKQDFEQKVEKRLKDYRKSVTLKGFRTGMAPLGLVKKMYGNSILVEEVNKILSNDMNDYIQKEMPNIIGDVLPIEEKSPSFDIDNLSDLTFSFEVGFAPEINLNLTKEVEFPLYKVKITDEMLETEIERLTIEYGQQKNTGVVSENSLVYCEIEEITSEENEQIDSIYIERTPISVTKIADEEIKNMFMGANESQVLNFDVAKAFANDADLAALFAVEQAELEEKVKSKSFNFTIIEILDFTKAELNSDFFDKIYGMGKIQTQEEFKEKVIESIKKSYEKDSLYRFRIDAKEKLMNDNEIALPDEFLKRWIKSRDKSITDQHIEKEYDAVAKNFRWDLLRTNILKQSNLKVTDADIKASAVEIAKAQFAQYGMGNLPDEQYGYYAETLLKDQKYSTYIRESAIDNKALTAVFSAVSLSEKEVSMEEFNQLFA